jgi:hypothetical protein
MPLFPHYEYPGKCEWLGGGLDAFVRHYNEKSATAFALTQCLDIVRISGQTPKEPEVLLTDVNTGARMVIERKSVVWPRNYLHRHRLEHDFAAGIWKGLDGQFKDDSYRLTVYSREFERLGRKEIKVAAQEISAAIAQSSPSDLPIRRTMPLMWSLRKTYPGEDDSPRDGITVSHELTPTFDDFDDAEATEGTALAIRAELETAAAKFGAYSNDRRLVLLDFYGDQLWEDDILPLVEGTSIPGEIDEVWRTVRAWVSADGYEIGYDRLYARPVNQ